MRAYQESASSVSILCSWYAFFRETAPGSGTNNIVILEIQGMFKKDAQRADKPVDDAAA